MKALMIDFAPRSVRRTLTLIPAYTWLLFITAAVIWAVLGFRATQLIHERQLAEKKLSLTMAHAQSQLNKKNAYERAASRVTIPESQAYGINTVIERLNLPWRDLFDALEAATPATIALLTIEPIPKNHVLKGTAEAKSSDDMIAYIEQLKKQPLFSNVLLTRHEINEQDAIKPIRFQFEAEWIEALP